MNKMTKGALATGVGVALLMGGGGTLAVWNASATSSASKIVSGDLQMEAGDGEWTNSAGVPIALDSYKVVPGDVLTFKQPVTVTLDGQLMKAELKVTDTLKSKVSYLSVGNVTLKGPKNDVDPANLDATSDGVYTASVSVTFDETTGNRIGARAVNALGTIGFELKQIAPSTQP